ncbi:polysaccharide biosynthesis/export family protein [Chondromyces crocatus]|uniref:Outer membrane polysaccharide exporter n=1 Tax=Chondromyces crocatus TaxID=52 RepID=A0A0K1EB13_CHOCO|nr:polysaccharide biosynthesis/export family protein [Chondromyces crocatus]AKT37768.1 outer membrane polysaccharide exporter [Chondromyces crocatus]
MAEFALSTRRLLSIVAPLLVALSGCAPVYVYDSANYAKEFDPRAHEYVIGVGDSLQINVWRMADLSSGALVRPDGIITLPLVGDVFVAGSTPSQVRAAITKRLSEFVKDETAVVTIAVTSVNSYRFVVSGNVAHAGIFTSTYYVSVSEALAMAGGPNQFASTDQILLIRMDAPGKFRHIPINYDSIVSREHPEQDLVLKAGDTVYVP